MGYINGKPLSANSSLRLPLSSVREVFHHRCRLEMHRPAQGLNRLSVLQDGILLYHPLEDSLSLDQVVGCTHHLALPYLKDNPIGYVDMGFFCFGVAFLSMMSETTTLQKYMLSARCFHSA